MSKESLIYLDYNATTPVDPEVLNSMLPFFSENFHNAASATHAAGRETAGVVASCRVAVSEFLGSEPGEIIFTSGSTESINLAIKGVSHRYREKGNHIITWQTEHRAVLDVCKNLEESGFKISYLPVNREGLPDLYTYENTLRPETILTIMMLANNETGVIQPVREFADAAHRQNSIFFCDATQAAGKMLVNVNELKVDMLCISAHKMYGPKGTGALFIRRKNPRVSMLSQIQGGGHENGLRSGTLNVPGIVGLAKACEIAGKKYWDDTSVMSSLRTLLEQMLTSNGRGYVNGSIKNRLPNTTNICFPGNKADTMLVKLPRLALATGSACSSALPEPSHVLQAMGLTDEEAFASIRFSLGRFTTHEEINEAVNSILPLLN